MAQIDISALQELAERFQQVYEALPQERAALHRRIGEAVQGELGERIASSLDDSSGKVRSWQRVHLGSKGGYAAIRPAGTKDSPPGKSGPDGPGAITTYLERGHRIRPPKGGKGYRPRIRVGRAAGRGFYQGTQDAARAIALREAQAWGDEIARKLEGKV